MGHTPRVTTRQSRPRSTRGRPPSARSTAPDRSIDRSRPIDSWTRSGRHPHSATRDDEDDDDEEDLDGEEDGDAGEEDGVARQARGEETGEEGAGEKGERERPARRFGRGAFARDETRRARAIRARCASWTIGSTDETKNARDSTQIAFPFGDRPAWLDGSLPGDRGFDPFELGKKSEYLQFSPDALDGSAAKNPSGNVIGKVKATDNKPKARTLAVRARTFFVVSFAFARGSFIARAGRHGRHHPSDIDRARDRVKIWF